MRITQPYSSKCLNNFDRPRCIQIILDNTCIRTHKIKFRQCVRTKRGWFVQGTAGMIGKYVAEISKLERMVRPDRHSLFTLNRMKCAHRKNRTDCLAAKLPCAVSINILAVD